MQINNQSSPNFGRLKLTKQASETLPHAGKDVKQAINEIGHKLKHSKKWDLEIGIHDDMFMHRIISKDKQNSYIEEMVPIHYNGGKTLTVMNTKVLPSYNVGFESLLFNTKENASNANKMLSKQISNCASKTYAQVLKDDADKVLMLENVDFIYKRSI